MTETWLEQIINWRSASVLAPGDRVIYIPEWAAGTVSSIGENVVFVRFDNHVARFGWEESTSQACDPISLRLEVVR